MKLLFVCQGNTCRSPMAACLMEAYARQNRLSVTCTSAGTDALCNAPASEGAIREMARRGLSLRAHRSSPLGPDCAEADAVIAMNESIAWKIHMFYPSAQVFCFDPPIADPVGGGDGVYREVAEQMLSQFPSLLLRIRKQTDEPQLA